MQKNKTLRAGISIVLSFFLAVSLLGLFAGGLIKSSYLPGNAWRSYLLGSGYGSKIAATAAEEMQSLMINRGIAEEQTNKMITEDLLYTEYGYCVDDILENREQEIARKTVFVEGLKESLMEYLQGNDAVITQNMETEVDSLMKEMGSIYESYLNPSWLAKMMDYSQKISGNITIMLAIASIFGILCIGLLWFMYHYKHRALRYMCYSTVTSVIGSGALLIALNQTDWIQQAGIGPDSYTELIQGICQNGMKYGLLFVGIEVLLTVLLAILMKHLKHSIR